MEDNTREQLLSRDRVIVKLKSNGLRFINGVSSSYENQYQHALRGVVSESELTDIVTRLNDTLLSFWPCTTCYVFGFVCTPFTFGTSLLCPHYCVSQSDEHANKMLLNVSLKAKYYDRKINYWWNGNTKECVKVSTFDGKFESISQTTNSDCNQKGGKGDNAAAIAIGAAALLGVAALASKSHHRGDRYNDEGSTSQFERGYRDGLYNQSYHNYDRSDGYSNGYEQGVRERGHQTSYRSHNYDGGGYSSFSGVRDLEGRSRDSATGQLMSRGFTMRDSKRVEDGRYMTWWRAESRQCVILHSQNGYVVSVESVSARTCSY